MLKSIIRYVPIENRQYSCDSPRGHIQFNRRCWSPHLCTGVFTGISLGNENSRRKSQKVEARPPIPGFITRTGLYDTGVIPPPTIWVGLSLEMDSAWTIISQVVGLQPPKDEFVHTCFCMHLAAVGKSPWFHGCSAGARVEPNSPLIAVLCFISQVY